MTAKPKRTSPRRVLEILEGICMNPQTATASNLAKSLQIPLPTVYRFLDTLNEDGFIATSPGGTFVPGDRLRPIVFSCLQSEPEVTRRRAILTRLSKRLKETVSLSIPQGAEL
ncbi:MAG: helix-turn-helix domain-containing protein, partial [Rhodococcus sp.]|nr:helix-turn-helix domain-containing protein [Rhodococcus sp. (in: high G+C Gram-positive bacteria)]